MKPADDHWPATLQRVVASLEFRLADTRGLTPLMAAEPRFKLEALPALIQTAVHAAIEVDRWISGDGPDAKIDREAVVARKSLVRALAAEPPGSGRSPFTDGYAAAYRLQLSRAIWALIADHPRRRLEDLAGHREASAAA
jgi:hypothetical protein